MVDDDPFLADLVVDLLSEQGHLVISVPTASQAFAEAKSLPDLILLDVMLPDINGYEVCRALKNTPETAHIPVIMLTARADMSDKVGGLKAGADDYITKPFHLEELVARVEAMLRVKRGEDALRERNRELATLLEANRLLSSSLELRQVVSSALEMIKMAAPDAIAGAILLFSQASANLKVVAAWGVSEAPWLGSEVSATKGPLADCYQRGAATEDTEAAYREQSARSGGSSAGAAGAPNPRSLWCAPISHQGHAIGAIALLNAAGAPDGVRQHELIEAIAAQAGLAIQNARLFRHINGMFQSSIQLLGAAIDARDPSTHTHSQDVARYARSIAEAMGLPAAEVEIIGRAALLHDIGKIGVVDSILAKPGPLSPPEQAAMMAHPRIGASILEQMPDLAEMVPIVRHHHERWDGRGYPDGLAGEQIPLAARILAVADAFEAMTSNRPYRHQQSLARAVEALLAGRGSQFDPKVVDAFVQTLDRQPKGRLPTRGSARRRGANRSVEEQVIGRFRAREVALVYEVFRDAHVILDLPALLQRLEEVLQEQIPSCRFRIELMDARESSGLRAVEGRPGDGGDGASLALSVLSEERLYPLSLDGQVRAVLRAQTDKPGGIGAEDLALLREVAPQLALVIDAGLLHQQAREDAACDRLTGLYTPRYLRQRLVEEAARARRREIPLSVCLIDVDGRSASAPRGGKKAGDNVLATVAETLKSTARASDLAARYSEDELALVMPEADAEGASRLLERFEARLEDVVRRQADRSGEPVSVSVSYGVAGFPEDGAAPGQLLEVAERRLAQAKRHRVAYTRRKPAR